MARGRVFVIRSVEILKQINRFLCLSVIRIEFQSSPQLLFAIF